jgi:hypothetical protein
MLIDCFLFNNEFEVLSLRLATLGGMVDRFVLVEASKTFSGQPKPLHFAAHGHLFGAWRERITHITLDTEPLGLDAYFMREAWQRNQLGRGLAGLDDHTLVLVGDVDEIPRLEAGRLPLPMCAFRQTLYYYDALTRCTSRHWLGTVLCTVASVRHHGAEHIRRLRADIPVVENGGWHFSHTGGVDVIHQKLKAGSHREHDTPEAHAGVAEQVAQGADLFSRGEFTFERTGLAESEPRPLLREPARWPGLTTGRWV